MAILPLLLIAGWLAAVFWLVRMRWLGLQKVYPLLTTLLAFEVLTIGIGVGCFLFRVNPTSEPWYAWYWFAARAGSAVLWFCVVIEAYKRMLAPFDGFQRLGRVLIYIAFGSVTALVLWLVVIDPDADLRTFRGLWFLEERTIYLALTIVSVLLVLFSIYFQISPARNVLVVFGVSGIWFACQAALWSVRTVVGGSFIPVQTMVAPAIYLLAFGVGGFLMSQRGEVEAALAPSPWIDEDSASEIHALGRLQAVNKSLLRVFHP